MKQFKTKLREFIFLDKSDGKYWKKNRKKIYFWFHLDEFFLFTNFLAFLNNYKPVGDFLIIKIIKKQTKIKHKYTHALELAKTK